MRLRVVACNCGNSEPHRRFETDNRRETEGFFSIAQGMRILNDMLNSGEIIQTTDETAATIEELKNSGLPSSEQLTEREISEAVNKLMEFPIYMRQGLMQKAVLEGIITTDIADRIVLKLAEVEGNAIPFD